MLVPFGKFSIPVLVKLADMVGYDLLPSSFRESIEVPIEIGGTSFSECGVFDTFDQRSN
jgi:hypothetical protein